jgi:circadian clock protein KaiC
VLHGGIRCGSTCVLFGPTGGGKTTIGLHFLDKSSAAQPGLHFGFYETPPRLLFKAQQLGLDLASKVADGCLQIVWQPPTERELDALGNRLVRAVRARGVKRLFVDGIDGFVKSAADPDRSSHFFAALTNELRIHGVTTLYTHELDTLLSSEVALPLESISSLAENVLLIRYMAEETRFARLFNVIKLRDSGFDGSFRELQIGPAGAELVGLAQVNRTLPAVRGRVLRRLFERRR